MGEQVLRGQKKRVLEHLQRFGTIEPYEAWSKLAVYRLSDVIMHLREDYEIKTETVDFTNRFGERGKFGRYVYIGEKDTNRRRT